MMQKTTKPSVGSSCPLWLSNTAISKFEEAKRKQDTRNMIRKSATGKSTIKHNVISAHPSQYVLQMAPELDTPPAVPSKKRSQKVNNVSDNLKVNEVCPMCMETIIKMNEHVEGQDAVFCDGKGCQTWYHRWCAGLTKGKLIN